MLKRPEAEGAYIEDEEELVNAVEGIELGECRDFGRVFGRSEALSLVWFR